MQLSTTREVVAALGGVSAVAKLTERKYPAAWHWPRSETFPANTFKTMTEALAAKGFTAPAALWGQERAA